MQNSQWSEGGSEIYKIYRNIRLLWQIIVAVKKSNFIALTYSTLSTHPTNTIIKFAGDTTVIRLISGDDESAPQNKITHSGLQEAK